MKIKIDLTLDIDADAYAEQYGISKAQIRDHARALARHAMLVSGAPIQQVYVGARTPGGAPGMVPRSDGYRH